jgi:lysophospholipid acyltransferase (LPLAT)-like uncharacterized protein
MIRVLLPILVTLVAKTLRFRWESPRPTSPCVIMFWHGKMFGGWYASRKLHPVALVSKSKDGEILSAVLSSWRYTLVRGSSKKQGMEALQEAIAVVGSHAGGAIVITPDGPRGPRHRYKRGAFVAARELGVPLYHLHVTYSSSITLRKSWDAFEIPKPFSTVVLRAEQVDCTAYPDDREEQRVWLDALAQRIERKGLQ